MTLRPGAAFTLARKCPLPSAATSWPLTLSEDPLVVPETSTVPSAVVGTNAPSAGDSIVIRGCWWKLSWSSLDSISLLEPQAMRQSAKAATIRLGVFTGVR